MAQSHWDVEGTALILLIDNYDSFVFNLARYFQRLGQTTHVVRNDAITVGRVRQLRPAAIVLSPGPCTPNEAGCSLELVRELWREFPMLGVCLGHQTIAQAFGAQILPAAEPRHGRTSDIIHDGRGVFAQLPNPLTVCRYHSLTVDESSLAADFEVSARTKDAIIMGIRHREATVVGLQFHPESILTDCGFTILENFLRLAGAPVRCAVAAESELVPSRQTAIELPTAPVTF